MSHILRSGAALVLLSVGLWAGLPARADAATHRKPAVPHGRVVAHARAARPAPRVAAGAPRRAPAPALPLVVIDAGHGGRDSGAVGATGLLEKDVTLATALELRRELRAQKRVRVVLTRERDVFVPLAGRVARADGAALFVSIHADASPDPRAQGASVYVRAAPAAPVARLPASPGAIGHALADGAAAPPGSVLLQTAMVGQLRDDIGMAGDPARQAHLFVLGMAGVPSVLVEMGFLSNRGEERQLRRAAHRRVIAEAIRDAIGDYLDGPRQRL